ncbi:MAG: exopolyphosphatase [Lachnospiraceae bacterium]|nr:exopolyphosphatase [Lachnospiraceae bacterium]
MGIYEFGQNKMKVIDTLKYRLDLGTDSYTKGRLPVDKVEEMCRILNEFGRIMKSYHVTDYKAYGTSAVRETRNTKILLDQIEQRTGIHVDIISNSEQRFLDYKSVASKGRDFTKTIEKSTAIVDIGGGSIQISLFDKDKLDVTQNMKLGVLRLQESLSELDASPGKYDELLEEMIGSQMDVFEKLYLGGRNIENLIIVDDYVSPITWNRTKDSDTPGYITASRFMAFFDRIKEMNSDEFCRRYNVARENFNQVYIAATLIRSVAKTMGVGMIWAPGVTLTDGIAYEYGERKKLIVIDHDFESDIITCARSLSRRYNGDDKRNQTLENICMTIFDSMKKVTGLSKRDRLLLRIATILNDCGKYISMYNLAQSSYNIIMATEIIGLSEIEREIIAGVVKYNHVYLDYDIERTETSGRSEDVYMRVAKLTALLRIGSALDRSHRQKVADIKAKLADDTLVITVRTNKDITLEKGVFAKRADFFEEIFCIKPVINQIAKI